MLSEHVPIKIDGDFMTQLAKFGSLRGKRVFITGGGTGIGEAMVISFAEQGAQVAFVDIARDASLALIRRVKEAGYPEPLFRQCDITDIPALQATMADLATAVGDFDILVNNAANDQRHETSEVTDGMKKKGAGSIINVGSISWHVKNAGYPVYATSKAAVHGLTRGLAREFGAHGIRVNTVTPGWVMTQRQIDLWLDDAGEQDIKRNQCMPTKLMPQHVASMVLFLAADDGAMCTAQEFIVDAGWV
jgi:NAD(P)-dependent dehydrogenase (short-subunit alcohol dehydrogenase family)